MDFSLRILLNVEMLVYTVPFHYARFWIFRRDLRFGMRWFILAYLLILATKVTVFNLALIDTAIPGVHVRNGLYLGFMLLFNGLFFVAIRPLWQHVFVLGNLITLGAAVVLPISWICLVIFPNHLREGHMLMTCGLALILTLGMRPFITLMQRHLSGLSQNLNPLTWHTICLLPVIFFLFEVPLIIISTTPEGFGSYPALTAVMAALAMGVALEFLHRQISFVSDHRIQNANQRLADTIVSLNTRRIMQQNDDLKKERDLHDRLQNFNSQVLEALDRNDWSGVAAACAEEERLLGHPGKHRDPDAPGRPHD